MPFRLLAIAIITAVFSSSTAHAEDIKPKITSCSQVVSDSPYQVAQNTLANTIDTDDLGQVPSRKDITMAGIGQPSLWWAQQQFDPFGGRLVSDWLSNPQVRQIDLTVNWQLWTLLDYLARYRFINQFGTVARQYGYNLRIFNQQQQCLAIYHYNSQSNPPKWEIQLEGLGQDSLPVVPAGQ